MKQEVTKLTNEQLDRYVLEARVLRSKEIFRLTGLLFRLPSRLLKRSASTVFSADKHAAR